MSFGSFLDTIGTALHLPEFGFSEAAQGGATQNTNTKPLYGTDAYLNLNPDGSFANGTQQYVQTVNDQPVLDGSQLSQQMNDAGWNQATTFAQLPGGTTNATVPKPPTSPAPAGGTTTPAPVRPDRTNSINTNMAALAGADQQQTSGLAAIRETLSKLLGRYGEEATGNETNYTGATNTNKNNLQRNTQAALVNAAEGRRGLFSILSSLGALSGSGINLANMAVQKGANADISGATDTFGENRATLDTSIEAFREADKRRREDAELNTGNAELELKNQVAGNKQKIYSSLADDYSQMGDAGKAKEFADMVAALFPEVARTSVPAASVNYQGAAYAPSALSKYVAGEGGSTVKTTPAVGASTIPGLVALPTTRRRLDE